MTLTEQLSSTKPVDAMLRKLNSISGLIHWHHDLLLTRVKFLIDGSHFMSHESYCHLVWGRTTKYKIQNILISLKKSEIIIASDSYKNISDCFRKYKVITISLNKHFLSTMRLTYMGCTIVKKKLKITNLNTSYRERSFNFHLPVV